MKPILFTKSEASFVIQMLQFASFRGEESARTVVSVLDKLRAAEKEAIKLPSMTPVEKMEPVMLTLPDALSRIDPSARMRPGTAPVIGELVAP